jgi:uncharacterized protein YbjT (DUF2867 family)
MTLLVGATGLVGRAIVAVGGQEVTVLARRNHTALVDAGAAHIVQPEQWPDQIAKLKPVVLLCALGTTIKAAGSEAAFRSIDHDLVLNVGRAALAAGARQLVLVSSVGASANSRNFYLRTKGDTEDGLAALGFPRLDIIRPGLLIGTRSERRPGEAVAMRFAPIMDPLLIGALRRYRSISATIVARAMLALVSQSEPGRFIHENRAINAFAAQMAN